MSSNNNNQENLFDEYAYDWWNKTGNYKLLHKLNPLRLEYITSRFEIKNKKVLDIGCGWGGMAAHIYKKSNANVVGVTLSEEQIAYAQQRNIVEGL